MRLHMDVYRYFIADALFVALKKEQKTVHQQHQWGLMDGGGFKVFQSGSYVHVPLMVLRGGSVLS